MNENKTLDRNALLTELMSNHALLDDIGSAWRLFFHLVFVEKGNMVGTYDEIGESLGENGRTMRNWVKQLEKPGIIQCQPKGRRIEIKLLEPHIFIARAAGHIPEVHAEVPAYFKNNKFQGLLKIYEGAELAGSGLELKAIFNASDTTHK